MIPLIFAQATGQQMPWGQQVINTIVDPDAAAVALTNLITTYNLQTTLSHIGLALLALMAMFELYTVWIRSDVSGLVILGIKVLIVNYLITNPSFSSLILAVYGYFAHAGEFIVTQQIQTDLNKIGDIYLVFVQQSKDWLWNITHFVPMLFGELLMLVYIVLASIMLALYVFAIILSRMFITLAILLIPIIFPLGVWGLLSHTFISKWISTAIHATLLPLIAALALIMGLKLGALVPLQTISACLQSPPGGQPFSCIGVASGAFVGGVISSVATIFLMFGLDGIVRSFVGGTEISAAGVMAFRMGTAMVTGGIGGHIAAARQEAQRYAPQTTQTTQSQQRVDLGQGMTQTVSTTISQRLKQSEP